jgi:hypothetical protein
MWTTGDLLLLALNIQLFVILLAIVLPKLK